jgi:hypothetical protein
MALVTQPWRHPFVHWRPSNHPPEATLGNEAWSGLQLTATVLGLFALLLYLHHELVLQEVTYRPTVQAATQEEALARANALATEFAIQSGLQKKRLIGWDEEWTRDRNQDASSLTGTATYTLW